MTPLASSNAPRISATSPCQRKPEGCFCPASHTRIRPAASTSSTPADCQRFSSDSMSAMSLPNSKAHPGRSRKACLYDSKGTGMRFEIISIFPGFFAGIFEHGIVRRAQADGLLTVNVHDLRTFTHDRHRTVDDRPFGGGEGMVLKPEPLSEALASLEIPPKHQRSPSDGTRVILLSAQGRPFNQPLARELATLDRVVLICGRYEDR